MSLPMSWGVEWDDLKGHFQPKSFCDKKGLIFEAQICIPEGSEVAAGQQSVE